MTALLRYAVAVSVDGYIAPTDGTVAWLAPYAGGAGFEKFLAGIGGILMGRRSFELECGLHAWGYADFPVAVMTRRAATQHPPGVALHAGDVGVAVAELRKRVTHGDIWLFGGGDLAGQCLRDGLIDAMELTVIPVVLGGGVRLFGQASCPAGTLRLVESVAATDGSVRNFYRAA